MTDRAAIASIRRVTKTGAHSDQDLVAVEAPLAVEVRRATQPSISRSLGLLMRTPGHDEELVLGLLHGEGLIRSRADVVAVRRVARVPDEPTGLEAADVMQVDVADTVDLDSVPSRAQQATSACGLCGRLAIQSIEAGGRARTLDQPPLTAELIGSLPAALRREQSVFSETGGLHAAGLFDAAGASLVVREDVGRHNAVDKVIGWALAAGRLPARQSLLAVSGRVAFEIVQKAALAGIPVLVAVGAPSSLAIDAARAARMTLAGFVRDGRFNVYAGPERLR